MDLAEYLFKKKIKKKDFAKVVGCTAPALNYICHKYRSPNLLLAMKIFIATEGVVGFHEMLSETEEKKLFPMNDLFKNYWDRL